MIRAVFTRLKIAAARLRGNALLADPTYCRIQREIDEERRRHGPVRPKRAEQSAHVHDMLRRSVGGRAG